MPSFFSRWIEQETLIGLQRDLLVHRKQRIEELESVLGYAKAASLEQTRFCMDICIAMRRAIDEDDLDEMAERLDSAIVDWGDHLARLEEHVT